MAYNPPLSRRNEGAVYNRKRTTSIQSLLNNHRDEYEPGGRLVEGKSGERQEPFWANVRLGTRGVSDFY